MDNLNQEYFLVKKLSEKANISTKGSNLAAEYDLYSAEEKIIPLKTWMLVDAQISIQIPENCYTCIAPRSGLTIKSSINIGAGVIDADYRGPIKICIINNGQSDFIIKIGDRIAQLILERIISPMVQEVSTLEDSSRGTSGFGSTGK